jgi:hypothetical protein
MRVSFHPKAIYFLIALPFIGFTAYTQSTEANLQMASPLKLNYFLYQLKGKFVGCKKAKELGFCFSLHHLPTIGDGKILCEKKTDEAFSTVIGPHQLRKGKEYFIRPFAIIADKIVYGNEQTLSTINQQFEIGEKAFGGKIAYVFEPQDKLYVKGEIHGIIVADEDLKEKYSWNSTIETKHQKSTISISNQLEEGLGFGSINTQKITKEISNKKAELSTSTPVNTIQFSAAEICARLKLNSYEDWFLPSLNEMQLIWFNQTAELNLVSKTVYWTSTTYNPNKAFAFAFKEPPLRKEVNQELKFSIRPIRYF